MEHYPLIVVGAGPAGFCAAVAAARMGVRTLLAEQYGALGGAMTVGGVPYPMCFSNGERQVVAGIGWELIERLMRDGWAKGRGREPYGCVDVDSVMTACEMDCMAREAGVELMLNSKLCKATAENGRVRSAMFAAPEGLVELSAELWIDATGDGQLSALSGAAFEQGDEQGELQPGSAGFWMDGYRRGEVDVPAAEAAFRAARSAQRLLPGDYYGEEAWDVSELLLRHGYNVNHVEMDEVSARSRTAAALEGHARIRRLMNWAKRSVPELANVHGAALCPEVWPRESRRILGEGYVTAEDYRNATRCDDAICCSYYPMDVHKRPGEGKAAFYLEQHRLSPERVPSIPLSAMIVRGFENLMTAGRCISGDRMAQSAYRVQATCMAMGEAIGTAAALQARRGESMRTVRASEVAQALRENGAIVPQ